MGIGGIAKVAIGGIRCGVCRQSGEERGIVLRVNLAGSEDIYPFGVGDDEQFFPGDLKFRSFGGTTLVLGVWVGFAPLVLKGLTGVL
ncbi:hypothetical protein Tco_0726253 [Tanacetum coccineum]|uniref:Uncharacterized protein n=1 Tax=Tanacetum coccineum TaxID=301880 RepID=A0ABQ4YHF2_9ASTR